MDINPCSFPLMQVKIFLILTLTCLNLTVTLRSVEMNILYFARISSLDLPENNINENNEQEIIDLLITFVFIDHEFNLIDW